MGTAPSSAAGLVVGRYILYDEIAAGGMASVHIGRLLGPAGFSRTVAIKRLHAAYAKDPSFVAMFLDEARLAARIRHPNVVSTLDVAATEGEIFLVMDYVQGESLSRLLRVVSSRKETVPPAVATGIMIGVLYGLEAAHDATDERGGALHIVHRDVSPHNILVGVDGVARVVDFGIAKAVARLQTTAEGQIKGKIAYMSPEQLRQGRVDRRADVFAASIVLWEVLTGRRLFASDDPGCIAANVLGAEIVPPSQLNGALPRGLDAVVLRGLARKPEERFATARDMLLALESALAPASPAVLGDWVKRCVGETLEQRALRVGDIETSSLSASGVALAVRPPHGAPVELANAIRRRASTETAPLERAGAEPPQEPTSTERDHAATQVTDASLVTPVGNKAERRRLTVLLLIAACAIVVVGVVLSLRGTFAARVDPSVASSLASMASTPAPSPAAVSIASSSASSPEQAAPGPAPTSPAVTAVTTRAAVPADAPRRRPRPAIDCDPPYTWDAVRQIKVYKKQCQ